MFELILLIASSIIIARYLEKKYVVASAAHAVLTIVLLFTYFFSTSFAPFVQIGKNLLGENYYEFLHYGLTNTIKFVNIGVSAIFVIELSIFVLVSILAIVAFIKGFQKLAKKIKTPNYFKKISFKKLVSNLIPSLNQKQNYQGTYLVNCSLLN